VAVFLVQSDPVAEASELWRPAVVFPLSAAAEAAILNGTATGQTAVEVIPFDQGDLLHVWRGGLAAAINVATDAIIEEYEEELFSTDDLPRLIGALRAWAKAPGGGRPVLPLVERIIAASEDAVTRKMFALWIL
jgi:hypothetical protein